MKHEPRFINYKIINSTKVSLPVIHFHVYNQHIFTITISFCKVIQMNQLGATMIYWSIR